ncbi:hypothetical protein D3C72_2111290 [compost metagenome]
MDLLAVDGGNERLVDGLVDVVCDAVGRTLGVVHILVVFVAQVRVAVVGHQLRESPGRLHDALGMLVEHFEKIAFAWQQLGKQHGGSWIGIDFLKMRQSHDKTMTFE